MPPSATQSYQSCHSAVTELPRSRHGSHGIIPSHPHLPTLALPNATFGYSKSSELSRSGHGAATNPTASSHLIPISPHSLYLMPPPATQSHQSCHKAATELSRSRHGVATEWPQSHHRAAMDPTASSHLIHISPHSLYLMPPSATQSHQSCHGSTTEPPQS